jgi:hypothetical protein
VWFALEAEVTVAKVTLATLFLPISVNHTSNLLHFYLINGIIDEVLGEVFLGRIVKRFGRRRRLLYLCHTFSTWICSHKYISMLCCMTHVASTNISVLLMLGHGLYDVFCIEVGQPRRRWARARAGTDVSDEGRCGRACNWRHTASLTSTSEFQRDHN